MKYDGPSLMAQTARHLADLRIPHLTMPVIGAQTCGYLGDIKLTQIPSANEPLLDPPPQEA